MGIENSNNIPNPYPNPNPHLIPLIMALTLTLTLTFTQSTFKSTIRSPLWVSKIVIIFELTVAKRLPPILQQQQGLALGVRIRG
jgi:hypothetical protein